MDVERLNLLNNMGEIALVTRHNNSIVRKGETLAGMRVIPLVVEESLIAGARMIAGQEPLISLLPYREKKAAIIITGNEVFQGRIPDAFGPVIREKLGEFGVWVISQKILGDEPDAISREILDVIFAGADLVICTGGHECGPGDTTPLAVRNTGARVISQGVPVLPGSMFMLAYADSPGGSVPILGLPGGVMFVRRSVFDLVLPRILTDDPVTAEELAGLGHGGLCLMCDECTYPKCGFGK